MREFRVVGQRVPNVDAVKKASGAARYTADLKFERMLVGKILRSPLPHARILNIDVSRAERLPGVKAVVTARDTLKVKYGIFIEDQYVLAQDKVRFIGDEVAAVATTDEDTAQEALSSIRVDYEELTPVFDPEKAIHPLAPKIHDSPGNIATNLEIDRGDVIKAFEESDFVFEDTFHSSNPQHCNMEPLVSVSSFGVGGDLTVWASTQVPFRFRYFLSKILGISEGKIRVIQTYSGGAFGAKAGAPQPIYVISALLAMKSGRTVKIENSRSEEFTTNRHRLPCCIRLTLGCNKQGRLLAKKAEILANCGAYAGPGNNQLILELLALRSDNLYKINNIKTTAKLVYTNSVPSGSFRGFGGPQMHFALESLMDVIAEKLGIDPIDLRLKNMTRKGETTIHGWKVDSCGMEECLQRTKEEIGWEEKRSKYRGENRGVGIACAIHATSKRPPTNNDSSTAVIKVHEDGRVSVLSGEGDIGQGANTVFSQIVCEELGIDMGEVEILPVDTNIAPYCRGAFGSRVTTIGGNAIRLAASKVKEKLFEVASEKLEADIADLECTGGRVYVKGCPAKGLKIGALVQDHLYKKGGAPIVCTASFDPDTEVNDPKTLYGNTSLAYIFGSQAAEVEVDKETGKVKILNLVAAFDVGRTINPLGAEGQVEGGLVQGIGYSFLEEMIIQNGQVLNASFADYKIPTAPDIPPIKSILVESEDPKGPFGAKGVGEIVIIPTAPAIMNAIYDAIGIRFMDLPITPEKILKSLTEKEKADITH